MNDGYERGNIRKNQRKQFGDIQRAKLSKQPKSEELIYTDDHRPGKSAKSIFDRVVFRMRGFYGRADVRSEAMESIQRLGEKAVPVLLDILNNKDSAVKTVKKIMSNRNRLTEFNHTEDSEIDSDRLERNTVLIRSASAVILGKISLTLDSIGREGIAKAMIPSLKDQNAQLRYWATGAYIRIGESAHVAVQPLTALVRDKNEQLKVRHNAIEAIVNIGPAARHSVGTFIGIAKDKEEPESIRRAVIGALGEIGKYFEGKEQKKDLCDTLIDRLEEEDSEIVNATVNSFVALESQYVNELVALVTESEKRTRVRVNAIWALVGICNKRRQSMEFIVAQLTKMRYISNDPMAVTKIDPELKSAIDEAITKLANKSY